MFRKNRFRILSTALRAAKSGMTSRRQKGFSLVDTIVAVSLFATAFVWFGDIMLTIVKAARSMPIENAVTEDIRVFKKILNNEISNATLDYEEYYSLNVIQADKGGKIPSGGPFYGINYGVYGSRFYDPGKRLDGKLAKNPDDLGIECSYPKDPKLPCEIFYTHSEDLSTGQNPYKAGSNQPDEADAFCDNGVGKCDKTTKNMVDELYLIDKSGKQKTIIGRRRMNVDDWSIGLVRMEGVDLDQNGMIDVFRCKNEFNCEDDPGLLAGAIKYPLIQDLALKGAMGWSNYLKLNNLRLAKKSDWDQLYSSNTSHFFPILSESTTVKDLKFIISPIEDPYKAYAEPGENSGADKQPMVTIIMTIGLSKAAEEKYPGEFQEVTITMTLKAGVRRRVDSYPPVNDVFRTATDKSWISEVLPSGVKK